MLLIYFFIPYEDMECNSIFTQYFFVCVFYMCVLDLKFLKVLSQFFKSKFVSFFIRWYHIFLFGNCQGCTYS